LTKTRLTSRHAATPDNDRIVTVIVPPDSLEIDAQSMPLARPGCTEELCELVRDARAGGHALFPTGGGTKLALGLPPARHGIAVCTTKLAQVIDYPARDMTITVQAGITVAALRRILAAENQRLPIDVPQAEQATLGGILAANVSGPRRLGLGTLRDYVIGVSFMNDEGQQVKGGGRVVKNVAGYDLCKLCIGALGTLGILTQVTLKVVPEPEQHALVILAGAAPAMDELLGRLHQSQTRPVAIELLNPGAVAGLPPLANGAAQAAHWQLVVGYEGNADAVNWQVQQLVKELAATHSLEARVGPTAAPLWQALAELPGWTAANLTLKAGIPASHCLAFCRQLEAASPGCAIQAHAASGILTAHITEDLSAEKAAALVANCRTWTGNVGHLTVQRCPTAWKKSAFVWGPGPDAFALMRRIKEQLDSNNLFNPGRFVDGI
jgi:glycolate oxidase FAD binding subunit